MDQYISTSNATMTDNVDNTTFPVTIVYLSLQSNGLNLNDFLVIFSAICLKDNNILSLNSYNDNSNDQISVS